MKKKQWYYFLPFFPLIQNSGCAQEFHSINKLGLYSHIQVLWEQKETDKCYLFPSHVLCSFNSLWPFGQAPLPVGFFRQEYWHGLLFPSLGESSRSRDQTRAFCVSFMGRRILHHWATWKENSPPSPEDSLCNFFSRKQIVYPQVACSFVVARTLLSFTSLLSNASLGYMQSF